MAKPEITLSKIESGIVLGALVVASEYYQSLIKIQKTKGQKLALLDMAMNAQILHSRIVQDLKTKKTKRAK